MSSYNIVRVPLKVPWGPDAGPRVDLTCDWNKNAGYRVQIVTQLPNEDLARTSDEKDHASLSAALRDCSRRIQVLEREGLR